MSPLSWANLTNDKFKTTVLINLAGIMERMDEQILPALYNFIGQSFHATPSQLGTLTLCRAFVQALSSPIGGLSGMLGAGMPGNTICLAAQHLLVSSSTGSSNGCNTAAITRYYPCRHLYEKKLADFCT